MKMRVAEGLVGTGLTNVTLLNHDMGTSQMGQNQAQDDDESLTAVDE